MRKEMVFVFDGKSLIYELFWNVKWNKSYIWWKGYKMIKKKIEWYMFFKKFDCLVYILEKVVYSYNYFIIVVFVCFYFKLWGNEY